MKHPSFVCWAIALFLVVFNSLTVSAEKFIGGGGDNLFSNPLNWDGGLLPVAGSDIEIKADCIFDAPGGIAYDKLTIKENAKLSWSNASLNLNVESLETGGDGGTLDMSSGGTLILRKEWGAPSDKLNFISGSGSIHFKNQNADTDIPEGFESFNNLIIESDTKKVKLKGDITLTGNLNIVSGTLESDSKSIALAGNWNNSGTFDQETGSVVFTGCTVTVTNLSGNETFYDLSIPGCICVVFNDNILVTGTFTNPAGNLCNNVSASQTNFTTKAWETQGNLIDANNQFLGTTNSADLVFKTAGTERMRISSTGNVGIGTTTPAAALDVAGSDAKVNDLSIGKGGSTVATNSAFGVNALQTNTTGSSNTAIGHEVLSSNTTGAANTALGQGALLNNISGSDNVAVGQVALVANTSGVRNVAIGNRTLWSNTTGTQNTALGHRVLENNTIGANLVGIGYEALYNNTNGTTNVAIGTQAAYNTTSGIHNVAIGGVSMVNNTTGFDNTTVGFNTDVTSGNLSNATAIGANAEVSQSNSLILGNNANVGIGTSTPNARLHLVGALKLEDATQGAGKVLTSDAAGLASWQTPTDNVDDADADPANELNTSLVLLGTNLELTDAGGTKSADLSSLSGSDSDWIISGNDQYSGVTGNIGIGTATPGAKLEVAGADVLINGATVGKGAGTSTSNLAVGMDALDNNTTGESNTGVGTNTLEFNTTGSNNTALGGAALSNNTTGQQNTGLGVSTLRDNTTGSFNTASGNGALISNTSGEFNVAAGVQSMLNNTSGSSNAAYGFASLLGNITGTNNTAIGANANVASGNLINATAVGANAIVAQSNSLILGDNADVGIGISTPGAKLHVAGDFKLEDGSQGNGKVLTSDAAGLASWQTAVDNVNDADADPANEYNTSVGLVGSTLQITDGGGTKNVDLSSLAGTDADWVISGNDQYSAVSGNVGIGTYTPSAKFEVADADARINGLTIGKGGSSFLTNSAFGIDALASNTSGSSNTAIGHGALPDNTTGANNTAVGQGALLVNISGSDNTALGQVAMAFNTTGVRNTAVGTRALWGNTTAGQNTAVGWKAMEKTTIGANSTGVGYEALFNNINGSSNVGVGSQSLYNSTSGIHNVAVGVVAGVNNTSGFDNTMIGFNTDVTIGNLFNATALGADAEVDASNKIRLGSTTVTSIEGQVGFTTASDARIKDNIREDIPGLSFINKLRPVTYSIDLMRQAELLGLDRVDKVSSSEDIAWSGFLAQEVEKAAQEIGFQFSGVDKTGRLYGLRYSSFVVPLVKGMQEQQVQIDDLKTQLVNKDERIRTLEEKIDLLTVQVEKLAGHVSHETIGDNAFLFQNAPNPFGSRTSIGYHIPEGVKNAEILFYDMSGQLIKKSRIDHRGQGSLEMDAGSLTTGTYAYELRVDGRHIATRKMVFEH